MGGVASAVVCAVLQVVIPAVLKAAATALGLPTEVGQKLSESFPIPTVEEIDHKDVRGYCQRIKDTALSTAEEFLNSNGLMSQHGEGWNKLADTVFNTATTGAALPNFDDLFKSFTVNLEANNILDAAEIDKANTLAKEVAQSLEQTNDHDLSN